MAFDWAEFLTLAKELAQRPEEASLRSAVSRAYYAAFGKARAFLQAEGVSFVSDASDHALVWEAFRSSSDDVRYYIGVDGTGLRNSRNRADYDAEVSDIQARAQRAVRKAEDIFNSLERLSSDQNTR